MLLATTNPGKIREIRLVLDGLPLALVTLADFPRIPEPEETGRTFAENALLKARYYAGATGQPTVAEDSGLEIDALGGRPGVESARYPGATYPDKFRNLYRKLAGHPRPWTARYVCSVAIVQGAGRSALGAREAQLGAGSVLGSGDAGASSAKGPEPSANDVLLAAEGVVEGEIWPEPCGTHGFGYDPIFYYPPWCATFGEVDDERKLEVAHRGRAFRIVRLYFQRHLLNSANSAD